MLRSGWQSGSYFWAAVPLYVRAGLSLFTRSQRHECERKSLRLHRSDTTTRNVHALRFSQPHSHALTHVHAQRRHCRHRYAAGSTCVILSFQMTSAANALVLFTLQPLWATIGSLCTSTTRCRHGRYSRCLLGWVLRCWFSSANDSTHQGVPLTTTRHPSATCSRWQAVSASRGTSWCAERAHSLEQAVIYSQPRSEGSFLQRLLRSCW